MKYNIGEIFKYIDGWYQCVERPSDYKGCPCDICSLNAIGCYGVKECDGSFRTDKKSVVFKKLEKKEYENKLKTFNLEEAKAGKPVCTRDGRKARIICFDRDWRMRIVALVSDPLGESVHYYLSDGKVDFDKQNDEDLMMLPEKKEGWVNVYKGGLLDTKSYPTKKEAFDKACPEGYVDTVKVCWEE